ncbi:unnamed protein product [Clonostachys rosea f. rosea IK726]|uniref:Uncharacterized protein n=1 Tax=Clonostachys rosea f. rosea IK726 TaxID=1349383 RepID=A0ACA9T6W8_BIOOC|nr:unnamed protein product [Clonostachys rosea f. rosea IK726]
MQAWYAAAIDTTMRCHIDSNATNGTDPGLESVCKWTCAGDDGSESEDKSRMFIQDVLSRLTGLHMLTKRLSSRFDHIRRVKSVEGVAPTPPEGKKHNLPYSSALSQALISELRDHLTGLSQSTVERLRVW